MPKYRFHASRVETFAEITVEAATREKAIEKALLPETLMNADWQVSDGNYIDADDVSLTFDGEDDPVHTGI